MKRRLLLVAATAAVWTLLPGAAWAQTDRERAYESPQHFAAELRIGFYYPKVDDEFGGAATPFQDSFGENVRVSIGGEFDWQAFRIPYVGTIGPGLGVHYVKFGRPALLVNGLPSEEQTSLKIYPMSLQAVLRVDVLAREVGIPLVPYLKGGLGVALWRMSNGSGTAEIKDASGGVEAKGEGVSYGPQFALGGALLLDWFDEYASRQADQALGINNTYIFGEFTSSYLSNFNGTGMRVGADMFNFGLAFEF